MGHDAAGQDTLDFSSFLAWACRAIHGDQEFLEREFAGRVLDQFQIMTLALALEELAQGAGDVDLDVYYGLTTPRALYLYYLLITSRPMESA